MEEQKSDAERLEEGEIHARIIIEILGKPKEHVEKIIKEVSEKLKSQKDVSVVKEEIAEIKEQGKLFSSFIESEIWVKGTAGLLDICFDFLPSSVEILDPETIPFHTNELSGFLNDLQARLHNVEMVARNLKSENTLLKNNDSALVRNIIGIAINLGADTLNPMSKKVGIPTADLEKFLNMMVNEGTLRKEKDKYILTREEKKDGK